MPESDNITGPQRIFELASANYDAARFGLRKGDRLLAVNGKPFLGTPTQLVQRIERRRPGEQIVLRFARGTAIWDLVSTTARFGRWKTHDLPADAPEADGAGPEAGLPHVEDLTNWLIYARHDGVYDVCPVKLPWTAMIPPFHFLQLRLWMPLGLYLGLMGLAVPLGALAGPVLAVATHLYFWRAANRLFHLDRSAAGFRLTRLIAARSEKDLHRRMALADPRLVSVLDRKAARAAAQTAKTA